MHILTRRLWIDMVARQKKSEGAAPLPQNPLQSAKKQTAQAEKLKDTNIKTQQQAPKESALQQPPRAAQKQPRPRGLTRTRSSV
jgi:hypothetical protein